MGRVCMALIVGVWVWGWVGGVGGCASGMDDIE